MSRESHIQLIGWLHIVEGILSLLFVGFVFLAGSLVGFMSELFINEPAFGIVFAFFVSFLLIFSVPIVIVGIGLLNRRPWARFVAMILAFFSILNFPIGTVVSIYTVWALWGGEADHYFGRRRLAYYGTI